MAWLDSLTWFTIVSFLVALIFWSKSRSNSSKLRPPGPPGCPLVGNIFDVGRMPHENLQKLRSKYGPVVWLKLGTLNTVVIKERQLGRKQECRDFLDALLEYQGDGKRTFDKLSEKNVTIMILIVGAPLSRRFLFPCRKCFFGGTETTSGTVQWAMAELLRNPKSMSRLKTELYQVVGKSKAVQEDDLNELPYLQAVVKETMRLHPSRSATPASKKRNARH
ncbi:UNVERIFIED_CONTAM: Iridoid oxidase [Sesamum indicum]